VARQSITGVLAAAGPSCETSAQPLLLCSFHPRLSPSDSPTLLPFELFRPDRYNLYQAPEFYPTDSAAHETLSLSRFSKRSSTRYLEREIHLVLSCCGNKPALADFIENKYIV
jgi:hypothetical protein